MYGQAVLNSITAAWKTQTGMYRGQIYRGQIYRDQIYRDQIYRDQIYRNQMYIEQELCFNIHNL